jgi:predicted amidophosphoribosyltransferase
MYCPKCSQQVNADDLRYCSRCGFPLAGVNLLIERDGLLTLSDSADGGFRSRNRMLTESASLAHRLVGDNACRHLLV